MPKPMKPYLSLAEAAGSLSEMFQDTVSVEEVLVWCSQYEIRVGAFLYDCEVVDADARFIYRRSDGALDVADSDMVDMRHPRVNGFFETAVSQPIAVHLSGGGLTSLEHSTLEGRAISVEHEEADVYGTGKILTAPLVDLKMLMIRKEELVKLMKVLEAEGGDEPLSGHSELATKRRNTYLTAIAALCKELGIDVNGRGQAQRLTRLVHLLPGEMSDDTARTILREVQELLHSRT